MDTSRITYQQFEVVVLGSCLRMWKRSANEIRSGAEFFVELWECIRRIANPDQSVSASDSCSPQTSNIDEAADEKPFSWDFHSLEAVATAAVELERINA